MKRILVVLKTLATFVLDPLELWPFYKNNKYIKSKKNLILISFLLHFLPVMAWSGEVSSSALNFYPTKIEKQKLEKIGIARPWLKLLHYKAKNNGHFESYADGEYFFLAKEGKKNPHLELEANFLTLSDPKSKLEINGASYHPQCLFPARTKLLRDHFPDRFKFKASCPDFEEWFKTLDAKGVSMIFATSYPSNPASMFGHLFLRLVSKQRQHHLLDYSVTYAAQVGPNEEGLIYALKGLMGYFKGVFRVAPLYLKMSSYGNVENRGLFEYAINLNQEQTDMLLRHLWELYATTYFDYYFFDENCSYHLLGLLEAANPNWDFREKFKDSLYVAPNLTIREIFQDKSIFTKVTYYPSMRDKFVKFFETLSLKERGEFYKIVLDKKNIKDVNNLQVLKAIGQYMAFKKHKNRGKLSKKYRNLEFYVLRKLAFEKSKLKNSSVLKNKAISQKKGMEKAPHKAHKPGYIGVALGASQNPVRGEISKSLSLIFRFGLHGLLDPGLGHLSYYQVEALKLQLNLEFPDHKPRLDHLTLLSVKSLAPFYLFDPDFSWSIETQVKRLIDFCDNCHSFSGRGGTGIASNFSSDKFMAHTMLMMQFDITKKLEKGFRLGPVLEVGMNYNPTPTYQMQFLYHMVSFVKKIEQNYQELEFNQGLYLGKKYLQQIQLKISQLFLREKNRKDISKAQLEILHYF